MAREPRHGILEILLSIVLLVSIALFEFNPSVAQNTCSSPAGDVLQHIYPPASYSIDEHPYLVNIGLQKGVYAFSFGNTMNRLVAK